MKRFFKKKTNTPAPVTPTLALMEQESPVYYNWLVKKGSYVSSRHKLIYIKTPKVACTKFCMTIHKLEGLPLPQDISWLHNRPSDQGEFVSSLNDFDPSLRADMLNNEEWFRFSFVRNPYARLLSAYKNKIYSSADIYFSDLREETKKQFGYPSDGIISFRDFTHYICELPNEERNWHWRSQVSILQPEFISYDFLGKFEQFETDYIRLFSRFSTKNWEEEVKEKFVVSFPSPLPIAYDKSLAKKVFRAFQEDFELFNYHQDSWMYKS